MKAKISLRSVQATPVGSYLWDTDLPGFGLKVTKTGKRVFLVQKRPHKGAKTVKRYTLGAYPVLSPEEARTRAKALLATLTLGGVVPATRRAPSDRFDEQIEKYYHEHVKAKLKPSTQKVIRYQIDKHLIPEFGNMTLAEVTPNLVRSFHSRLGSKHPYGANRVLALLSKFFSWSSSGNPGLGNPCQGLQKFRERRREINELNLGPLLDPKVHPAIRLLLLTGMRKSEVLSLRWEYYVPRTHELRLPDSKTGGKTIYLSHPAEACLQELGPKPEGWVFPGERGSSGHLIGLQRIWKRTLFQVGLPLSFRIHDLRHHYASQAACLGVPLPMVGALLGHRDIKTTVRYVHTDRDGLCKTAQYLGQKLLNHRK